MGAAWWYQASPGKASKQPGAPSEIHRYAQDGIAQTGWRRVPEGFNFTVDRRILEGYT